MNRSAQQKVIGSVPRTRSKFPRTRSLLPSNTTPPVVANPPFGERVEQWREASIGMTVTRVGPTSPLAKMPLLLVNAQEDFHFQEDAQELERWLSAAGNSSIERHVVPNCNHFTIVQHLASAEPDTNQTMRLIKDFVSEIAHPNEIAPAL